MVLSKIEPIQKEIQYNELSFPERIAALAPLAIRQALNLYGYKRREEAEDLAQDALLIALEKQDCFSISHSLEGWLTLIIWHKWLENMRKAKRYKIQFIEEPEDLYRSNFQKAEEDDKQRELLLTKLEEAIPKLPYRMRLLAGQRMKGATIMTLSKKSGIRPASIHAQVKLMEAELKRIILSSVE